MWIYARYVLCYLHNVGRIGIERWMCGSCHYKQILHAAGSYVSVTSSIQRLREAIEYSSINSYISRALLALAENDAAALAQADERRRHLLA